MFIANRKKTGCKQYVFETFSEMYLYFQKKWYQDEVIGYMEFSNETSKLINKSTFRGGYNEETI